LGAFGPAKPCGNFICFKRATSDLHPYFTPISQFCQPPCGIDAPL